MKGTRKQRFYLPVVMSVAIVVVVGSFFLPSAPHRVRIIIDTIVIIIAASVILIAVVKETSR